MDSASLGTHMSYATCIYAWLCTAIGGGWPGAMASPRLCKMGFGNSFTLDSKEAAHWFLDATGHMRGWFDVNFLLGRLSWIGNALFAAVTWWDDEFGPLYLTCWYTASCLVRVHWWPKQCIGQTFGIPRQGSACGMLLYQCGKGRCAASLHSRGNKKTRRW